MVDSNRDGDPFESLAVDAARSLLDDETGGDLVDVLDTMFEDGGAGRELIDKVGEGAFREAMAAHERLAVDEQTVEPDVGPTLHVTEIREDDEMVGARLVVDRPPDEVDLYVGAEVNELLIRTNEGGRPVDTRHRLSWSPHGVRPEYDLDDPFATYTITPARPELPPGPEG